MFKFLRRYSKWILAVGGTLLMITFLVPFAFQGLGNMAAARGATWATVGEDDVEVTMGEQQLLQREMQIVRALNPQSIAPVEIKSAEHWFLLMREAQDAGLVGGTEDAISMLGETPAETLAFFTTQSGESREFVLQTIAKYRGVMRLIRMYRMAGHFSDRRLRAASKELFHTAEVQFILIEASADAADIEPNEEAIQEQFEEYADDLPGEGEYGFGYKLPDRVKLEWIEIPAESVYAGVEASPEFNEIELRKHWIRNPDFTFPEVAEGAPIPDIVREDLKNTLFEERMQEIVRTATDELRSATRGLERSGSYYVLPEDWSEQQASLPAIAEMLQEEFDVELPPYQATGDRWLSAEDVAELEGIGTATTTRFSTAPIALPELIRQLKEFDNAVQAVVQADVAGPPLIGQEGSRYIFRVTAADPSHRATDVSEVRDHVVHDLKRLADYEHLVATMSQLENEAEQDGLLSLLVAHPRGQFLPPQNISLASLNTLLIQAQMGSGLSAQPTALPVIGRNEDAVRDIIEHALALPMASVEEMTPEQRIFPVAVEDALAVMVVELENNQPLTRENFVRGVDLGVMQALVLSDELEDGEAIVDAFSFTTLAERHNFELARETEDEFATEGDGDGEEVASAGS